eukprot:TRINITY_DN4415_c0_g1_i2.p1 TRINITY_DN4415_c0_g1~~TRINITY_DN4415_c0_g1_i2.p1  ORF type:complete len:224 (+),score=35.90 TRINITY_DN4415_c0_g1_i2:260-931(+)
MAVCIRLLPLLYLASIIGLANAYTFGDLVPTQRRGQYHKLRTHWHDALGRHCPRFGVDRLVVLPIPKPTGYQDDDTYKLSLSFGREKYLTPWVTLLSPKAKSLPIIEVELSWSGTELKGVRARVDELPEEFEATHAQLKEEYSKPDHWPKHVMVRYTWREKSDVDVNTGLLVLFTTGIVLSFVAAIQIMTSNEDTFRKFVREAVSQYSSVGLDVRPVGEAKVE